MGGCGFFMKKNNSEHRNRTIKSIKEKLACGSIREICSSLQ